MKSFALFAICITSIVLSQAYSPSPMNRRVMIDNSLTALFIPSSLLLASELNETMDEERRSKSNTSSDAQSEFRIWRRRGSNWLQRRLEREEFAKQKEMSRSMEDSDMILSTKYERQKIILFNFGGTDVDGEH